MMTHKTLYLTIAISIGLHLGVLLPLISQQDTLTIYTPTRPVSQLTLVVRADTAQPQREKVVRRQAESVPPQVVTKAAPVKKPNTPSETPVTEETEQKPVERINRLANSTDPQAVLDHDMLEYLHAEFRLRFQYPLLARKRGWSGEVVIALNVNHKGLIHDIAVQKSSGYPVLDNNAMDTFRAIGLVSPAIQSRIIKSHHLSIPVVYKLTGG
jgi:periplasmic protein TonB